MSEIPQLFRSGQLPIDVALVNVSLPDRHGFVSLGTSVDVTLEAVTRAKVVIAQVNKHVPRSHGEGIVHVSNFDFLVPHDAPLGEAHERDVRPEYADIGRHVATLVEDGSTLQMGIGGIPDATLSYLTDRKDLGVHTEMFSEGVVDLVAKGVINNRHKVCCPL